MCDSFMCLLWMVFQQLLKHHYKHSFSSWFFAIGVHLDHLAAQPSISSALISVDPSSLSTAQASPALGAPTGKVKDVEGKRKWSVWGGGQKGKCQAPWAICQQAACWKKRRHASMSDPSETWVNIPELFTVLPLLLALMLILTDTWSQAHTHTYTNTYCHHFQSFSCWHLIVILFHSFSLSLCLSSSVLWAFKTENNIWLLFFSPFLLILGL